MNMLRIIILAAGKGTRMKGDTPKVLQPIANKPMLTYLIDLAIKTQMGLQFLRPIDDYKIPNNCNDKLDNQKSNRVSKWQVKIDILVNQELAENRNFQQIIEQYNKYKYTHIKTRESEYYEPIETNESLNHLSEEKELEESVFIKIKPNVIIQKPTLGTGHGVWYTLYNSSDVLQQYNNKQILLDLGNSKLQEPKSKSDLDLTLVLYGDAPLVELKTISKMLDLMEEKENTASINLGFKAADPSGYGRIITQLDHNPTLYQTGRIEQIVEDKEYQNLERASGPDFVTTNVCNAGIMIAKTDILFTYLQKECNHTLQYLDEKEDDELNEKNILENLEPIPEIYLTNFIGSLKQKDFLYLLVAEDEVTGANDVTTLVKLENIIQNKIRTKMLSKGVRLIAPETVFFSQDTIIGPGTIIHPYVVFGPNVRIESNAEILSFSHIHGSVVRDQCRIGPFSRLRPNTTLAAGVQISNFVEVKNSTICEQVKINHLSYIGDAIIGAKTNVGAGTVLCNYDGKNKNFTVIGAYSFIGANSSIIAPRIIGRDAVIGAGSVIIEDVPDDNIALSRSEQITKKRKHDS